MFRKKKNAFSLIELSIVIVIIGILIIGVIGSKHLIKKARISSAQSSTLSSPIYAVMGNKFWIESSLASISLGDNLSNGDYISSWQNNANIPNSTSVSSVGTGPIYSNSINNIQAVKFDSNSNSNYLKIDNATLLNGTDYTIFILDKRLDTNSSVILTSPF